MPDLPDIRQKKAFQCGRAALEVVWAHFGVSRPPLVPSTPLDGTSPDVVEALLWYSGLRVQSGNMDVADLRYHTGRGRPVLCVVTQPEGVGHWVAVGRMGRLRRGRRLAETVVYQCPFSGPAEEFADGFEARWHDFTRRGVAYPSWGIAAWKP